DRDRGRVPARVRGRVRARVRGRRPAGPGEGEQGEGQDARHGGGDDGRARVLAARQGGQPGGQAGARDGREVVAGRLQPVRAGEPARRDEAGQQAGQRDDDRLGAADDGGDEEGEY